MLDGKVLLHGSGSLDGQLVTPCRQPFGTRCLAQNKSSPTNFPQNVVTDIDTCH